jgi:RHS repeat-associated protein
MISRIATFKGNLTMKQSALAVCLIAGILASSVSQATMVNATSSDGHSLTDNPTPISISAKLELTFDQQVPAVEDITLIGPNGPADIAVSSHDQSLTVQPNQNLLPATRYTLFVSEDHARKILRQVSFTTSALTQLSTSSASGSKTYVRAGTTGSFRACTESAAAVRGFAFCANEGRIADGVFHPGANNAGGHWRLNTPLPDIATASDFAIPEGVTAVYGVVRRIDDTPLARVTVSMGTHSAQTDAAGRFTLLNVDAGHQKLEVDGGSANQSGAEYGRFGVSLEVEARKANGVPFNLFVPRITERDKLTIPSPTVTETVLTHPAIPGFELHIPAGTVLRDRNGNVLTQIAIVPMPVDRSPVPVPDNFAVYYSLQPGELTVQGLTPESSHGIEVVYPNYSGETRSGQKFWYYDADRNGWATYTYGHISDDRRSILPNSSFGAQMAMPQGATTGGPDNAEQNIGNFCAGDPVDCATGTFLHNAVDLTLHDMTDVTFGHRYNSSDLALKAFGRGGSNSFGMYIHAPNLACVEFDQVGNEMDLVDTDGRYYRFFSVAGSASATTIFTDTSDPGRFFGAILYLRSTEGMMIQLRDGTQYNFNNGCPSNLASISDRFGNTVNLSYNAGLLSQVSTLSGRFFRLSYNASNFISSVADNAGRAVNFTYAGNNLDTVTYPDSTTEKYSYDTSGNMLTVTDRRNNVMVTNHYDANNRVDQQTYPDSTTFHFAYTLTAGAVTATDVTNTRGYVKHIVFDAARFATSVTQAYGTGSAQQTSYARNANELITDKTDALSRTTHYTYDAFGDALTETFLYGTPTAKTYTYTYTPDTYQIASVKDPLNHTTTFTYTKNCLTAIKDALGHTTSVTCNSSGQPLTVKDALNHTTTLSYQGSDVRTTADALGRTTTLAVDGLGRAISIADPLGRTSLMSYDLNGMVGSSTDPLNQTTTYTHDGNGNLTDVLDPNGGHTHYGYDSRNRRTSRTDALGRAESWTYDGEGDVLTYTDRKSQTTAYTYDALNRVNLITYADASTVTPSFDAGNRLTSVADSVSGTIDRYYDGLDNLLEEDTPQGTVSYTYDAASRRETMQVPDSGGIHRSTCGTSLCDPSALTASYIYDAADRLTQIYQDESGESVVLAYDNANRRSSLTLPNGVVTTYAYDSANELTGLTYKNSSGTTLASTSYTYDAAGQRLTRTGGFGSDRLPTPSTGTNTFNLANQQTVWNGYTLGYDLNGDPGSDASSSPATSYIFDARHRLTQIMQGTTNTASFQYDALGRRTQKVIDGSETDYLYDGPNAVQETMDGTPVNLLTGLGIDERYARDDAGYGRAYFLTDALNSTVALTDDLAAVQQTYSYEPYGEVNTTGSSDNPYQYTGRENDGTGLYYYRARYYSPTLKRFISEDPMGLEAGLNNYEYVLGNPISFIDPWGLDCTYSQSTGAMSCTDANGNNYYNGNGYSGTGTGRNNSGAQGQADRGPIPRGDWRMTGDWHTSANTGRNTIVLQPEGNNTCRDTTRDCSSFRIHGNIATNDASHGCIVLPPDRTRIHPDELIHVTP